MQVANSKLIFWKIVMKGNTNDLRRNSKSVFFFLTLYVLQNRICDVKVCILKRTMIIAWYRILRLQELRLHCTWYMVNLHNETEYVQTSEGFCKVMQIKIRLLLKWDILIALFTLILFLFSNDMDRWRYCQKQLIDNQGEVSLLQNIFD